MGAADLSISDADLDLLDAYLLSDQSPPEYMLLSDLDGFLTGIAIGPELVMPSEWLPHVWGGEEPMFDDPAQATAISLLAQAQHPRLHRFASLRTAAVRQAFAHSSRLASGFMNCHSPGPEGTSPPASRGMGRPQSRCGGDSGKACRDSRSRRRAGTPCGWARRSRKAG
jgi:hypothetical protein